MFSTVRHVAVALTDDVYLVGLAEEAGGAGASLIFQEPVDPDLIAETHTYCVTNEAHSVMYGGVRSVSVQGDTISLDLDHDSASEAGLPSSYVLTLQISPADLADLRAGLRRVLTYGRETEVPRLAI